MRTAVVQGKDSTLVFDYQNGAMRAADDEPAFAREFLDRACALEFGAQSRLLGAVNGNDLGLHEVRCAAPLADIILDVCGRRPASVSHRATGITRLQ
jgi:hypothetical protein